MSSQKLTKQLFIALDKNDVEGVKICVEQGANVTEKDVNSRTPLHWAVYRGYTRISKLLIDHGADVNGSSKDKRTPLHRAANWGRLNTAKMLLENGADINSRDIWGWTPLRDAIHCMHKEVIDLLKQHGGTE